MPDTLQPSNTWDKRDDESDKAYEAFTAYLHLGSDRSLDKVRQKYAKSTSYKRQLQKWSSAYLWVSRASAYDASLRSEIESTQAELRNKLLKDEFNDGLLLLSKWRDLFDEAELQFEREETKKDISTIYVEVNIPGHLALAKLRREIGDQMRRALGLPLQITTQEHTGKDGGAIILKTGMNMDDL
jgi:hypothetical protein